jgi:thioredoxin 1
MKKHIIFILLISFVLSPFALAQSKKLQKNTKPVTVLKDTSAIVSKSFITFVELGSVNCIPCKAMQKVMKAIEEKYGSQITIAFFDVWKEDQAHYSQDYKIRLIPTQIFLDPNGKELMRHEGYFPEKEIDAFLQSKGLKPNSHGKE